MEINFVASFRALLLGAGLALVSPRATAQVVTAQQAEFFEKRIRPVLVDRCFKCHSAQSEKLKGGLRLDSREGTLKGGDTSAAIDPGHPDKSLLIEAIHYGNVDLQMPPKGMLPKEQIADFEEWVRLGAPWPGGDKPVASTAKPVFDLNERKRFWCWQPVRSYSPPAVQKSEWPANDVDRFILAKLEENHLDPAPEADRRTLIRRLSFDLTGLPPSPEEVLRFVNDPDPKAWDDLVDRLLASPGYGERWARHWLDLVRYAETMGHEFDYSIANAWAYRDYVIRAFNQDIPYSQFVREQVAGDLLPARYDPTGRLNESQTATAFLWLAQQTHSPVDVRLQQADLIDNEIDVISKSFQGLTVACARCHDHKFDAITTKDYYSLYGILESSRLALRAVDHNPSDEAAIRELSEAKAKLRAALAKSWLGQLNRAEIGLRALQAYLTPNTGKDLKSQSGFHLQITEVGAAQARLVGISPDSTGVQKWLDACMGSKLADPGHPFHGPAIEESRPEDVVYANGANKGFASWTLEGAAMSDNPVHPGDFAVGISTNGDLEFPEAGTLHSRLRSARLEGSARSPTFIIGKNFLHLLAAGHGSRFNIVVDNFVLIRDPIYGTLKHSIERPKPGWTSVDVSRWKGQRAYLEFEDVWQPDCADPSVSAEGYPKDAFFSVQRVVFSDNGKAPATASPSPDSFSWDDLAKVDGPHLVRQRLEKLLQAWEAGSTAALEADPAGWRLIQWMAREHLLDPVSSSEQTTGIASAFSRFHEEQRAAEKNLRSPIYVVSTAEGNGMDETVFIRGIPRNPGPVVPRRFLEAVAGPNQTPFSEGSGRMELARALTDSSNPLTARVMVNRVWGHLFGQGIVPSPDNFGALGQAPSHPELLDWLAVWYQNHGWSTKQLIRELVASRAYRMSSRPASTSIESADTGDRWLHRMRVRRLEGEAIRDSILSVAGDLQTNLFGPSVPVYLTPFMDGRGRPGQSGPLDGDRRRSIYLEVRRNFLNPFMMAFDAPAPFTAVGRRTDSNLPAQALILLNDPFVINQAGAWARRVLSEPFAQASDRIRAMYISAYGRPPRAPEEKAALEFLDSQGIELGLSPEARLRDEHLWADLAHVLMNVNEFIYLE